ncbi:MAG: hypothetical protein K6F34_02250, partial [Lachnospiraceae bacterium]|nr:hypothetical protein [Lachnospiraceae bacterium]
MYKRNSQGWIKHIDFILWDVISLQIAFVLAFIIRQGLKNPYSFGSYRNLAIIYTMIDIIIAAGFNTMSGVLRRGYYREFVHTLKQVSLVLVVMTLCLFLVKISDTFSRITIILTAVFHLVIGYILRILWKKLIVSVVGFNWKKTTLLLVADEEQVPEIIKGIEPGSGIEFSGLILSNRNASGEEIAGLNVVANLSDAADFICREWVDEVFICPRHLTDIEVHRSALYKSIEGFIEDDLSEFSRTEYNA